MERIAGSTLVLGAVVLAAGIGAAHVLPGRGSDAVRSGISETRTRLDRARALRYDATTAERDELFDAQVGSLLAGVGKDTPEEIKPFLDRIAAGRERERGSEAVLARDRARRAAAAADADVDEALALASRAVGRLAAESGLDSPALVFGGAPVLWAAGGLVLLGVALEFAARSKRAAERRAIGGLVECDDARVHDGGLASAVGRFIVYAKQDAANDAYERSKSQTRPPLPGAGSGAGLPASLVPPPQYHALLAEAQEPGTAQPAADPAAAMRSKVTVDDDEEEDGASPFPSFGRILGIERVEEEPVE